MQYPLGFINLTIASYVRSSKQSTLITNSHSLGRVLRSMLLEDERDSAKGFNPPKQDRGDRLTTGGACVTSFFGIYKAAVTVMLTRLRTEVTALCGM